MLILSARFYISHTQKNLDASVRIRGVWITALKLVMANHAF